MCVETCKEHRRECQTHVHPRTSGRVHIHSLDGKPLPEMFNGDYPPIGERQAGSKLD